MRIPLIGIFSSVCTALGLYGLYWYHNLTKEEQEEADRLACQYAQQLYSKGLDQLTSQQLSRVQESILFEVKGSKVDRCR